MVKVSTKDGYSLHSLMTNPLCRAKYKINTSPIHLLIRTTKR